jgi:hypothetical protein
MANRNFDKYFIVLNISRFKALCKDTEKASGNYILTNQNDSRTINITNEEPKTIQVKLWTQNIFPGYSGSNS